MVDQTFPRILDYRYLYAVPLSMIKGMIMLWRMPTKLTGRSLSALLAYSVVVS